jgi:hypothetical protein
MEILTLWCEAASEITGSSGKKMSLTPYTKATLGLTGDPSTTLNAIHQVCAVIGNRNMPR